MKNEIEFKGENPQSRKDISDVMERVFPAPNPTMNKKDAGDVLIVAGYGGMAGAAIMSAKAAFRTGAGLVRIATLRENFSAINCAVPEGICMDAETLIDNPKLAEKDAIAFGPGMGKSEASKNILKKILWDHNGPIVLDADALNSIAESHELQSLVKIGGAEIVLTPHEMEARRLVATEEGISRKETCERLHEKYKCIIVLKGKDTLVFNGEEYFINSTGNPGMATAGSGDVLTGTMVAILGRGVDLFEGAMAGVCLHGLAGDLAKEDKGTYGMVAGDIIEQLPYAIKEAEWKKWI